VAHALRQAPVPAIVAGLAFLIPFWQPMVKSSRDWWTVPDAGRPDSGPNWRCSWPGARVWFPPDEAVVRIVAPVRHSEEKGFELAAQAARTAVPALFRSLPD